MKISTRGRYALRLMIDLAQNKEQGIYHLKMLLKGKKFLSNILNK